jgi:hypothetical protein
MLNNKEIKFTPIPIYNVDPRYSPVPASSCLPDWYKKTDSYMGSTTRVYNHISKEWNQTIKKCMPVFDALCSGYIIPTYVDLLVSNDGFGKKTYTLSSRSSQIPEHNLAQAPYHPASGGNHYPKWLNPWGIKTPKGYSCLFIPPVHHSNVYFSVLEGVVDTDTYNAGINFPFVLNDSNFEGIIPAGTPLVQVIPFKRENWKSAIDFSTENAETSERLLETKFYDRYKRLFWSKKEYK